METVTTPPKFGEVYSADPEIFRKFVSHYVRLGTYRATEIHLGLALGSFEEYLCDYPEFADKVNTELLGVGTSMAIRAIPSAVNALVSVIQGGSDDTKHTLQAVANLTQIVTKFQSSGEGSGNEDTDDIEKLYKKFKTK